MAAFARTFWHNESGQDLAEYGLLIALIAVFAAVAVTALGTAVANLWNANAEGVAGLPGGSN